MILQVEQSYSYDTACHEAYLGAAWWAHAGTAHNCHTVISATRHQGTDVGTSWGKAEGNVPHLSCRMLLGPAGVQNSPGLEGYVFSRNCLS